MIIWTFFKKFELFFLLVISHLRVLEVARDNSGICVYQCYYKLFLQRRLEI